MGHLFCDNSFPGCGSMNSQNMLCKNLKSVQFAASVRCTGNLLKNQKSRFLTGIPEIKSIKKKKENISCILHLIFL